MSKRGHGEGSIYKRKDGRWMGSIVTGRNSEGKLIRATCYGKSKQEVIIKLDKIKKDLSLGLFVEPDKTLVKEWVIHWLCYYKKIKLKPRTYDSYEFLINNTIIPCIGMVQLQKLTARHIQKMYNKRYEEGLSSNSIYKVNVVLKAALKQAVIEGYIAKNPADFVEMPEVAKKEIKIFTREEQRKFEEYAKMYRVYEAFIVNLDTGLRTSELLALNWDDIDLKRVN